MAITNTSLSQLLLARVLPGLVITAAMLLLVGWLARRDTLPSRPQASLHQLGSMLLASAPTLFAPVLLLGGILAGILTPAEASAIAAGYSILVAMLCYREMSVIGLLRVMWASAMTLWLFSSLSFPKRRLRGC